MKRLTGRLQRIGKARQIRCGKEKLRQPLKAVGVKGENKPRIKLNRHIFAERARNAGRVFARVSDVVSRFRGVEIVLRDFHRVNECLHGGDFARC